MKAHGQSWTGMLFREIFTIMVDVDNPFLSSSQQNISSNEIFSLGLHSRHTIVGDDGPFIPDEIKCLEGLLPENRTAETFVVYVMSDRPKCAEKLKEWLQEHNCTGVTAPISEETTHIVLDDEMEPNQGMGFIRDLSLSSSARSGLIGDYRRSSFMLLVELVEYDRRIEDWKMGKKVPTNCCVAISPSDMAKAIIMDRGLRHSELIKGKSQDRL